MLKVGNMHINSYHRGLHLQRGKGIGSLFNSIFRTILPIGKKILSSPTTKKIAKTIGKKLGNIALDTVGDVLDGNDLKSIAQKRLHQTKQEIGKAIRNRQSEKPRQKRKKPLNFFTIKPKKRRYHILN